MGQPYTIRWETTGAVGNIQVHLYRNGTQPANMVRVIHGGTPNTGSLVWNVECDLSTGTGYYIGLSEVGDGTPWDFSNSSFSITGGLPGTPGLSTPSNGVSLCSGQSQSYCWNTVSGATNYRIEWDDNSGFSSPTYENTSSTCFSKSLTGSGTWYWRVRADNACGSGSWSTSRNVQLLSVPAAVTLVSPANSSTVLQGATQQFCWNTITGATSYIIQWDDNSGFSSPTQLSTSSTCINQSFASTGTWYWRAQASNSCGSGSWSSTRNIIVESPTLGIPTLTAPTNGLEICSGETINFCWSTVSAATSYRIQWADNSGFGAPQEMTASATCLDHELVSGGTWYWRVRAEDGATQSGWSSVRTVSVIGPSSIVLTTPNGGETYIQNSSHDICWTYTGCEPTGFSLLLSTDCGLSYSETLVDNIDASESCWTWNNVEPVSNQLKVKVIASVSFGDVSDESNACFSIDPPADCIPVSIADFEGNAGEVLQIPVMCEDVTGENITAFEMVLHFNPDSMQITVPAYSTTGCLTAAGWTILVNPDNNNGVMTIGGFGVSALAGSGCLAKIAVQIPANAIPATCSQLEIESFVFNEGLPCAAVQSGRLCARATVGISGCIRYYSGSLPLAGLEIGIIGGVPVSTDGGGCYEFTNLAINESYTINPVPCASELDPGNSISFYDASLAAQNAIGLITLDELQEMAADVSCNNDVSFYDASLIAQYAIGLIDAWPSECQCRIMIFEPSERIYEPLTEDQFNQDFNGILMGDVSGNWSPTSPMIMPAAIVPLEEDAAQPNSIIIKNHSSSDAYSFEMEVSFDHQELQFEGLELLGNAREWQPYISERNGVLRIGAFGTVAVPESQDILSLKFNSPAASSASGIRIERLMINESFLASASRTITAQASPESYVLNQNYPNPFNSSTAITYSLPAKAFVSLIVFNSLGEVIANLAEGAEEAGQHEVRFEANDLPTGLYFCELKAGGVRLVRKMMMIK
jgi:hypothetical protein